MALFRRLATLAAAAEAARRYARKNPDQASRYVDQAARFLDKQTKGKYSGQISGVAAKAKGVAGLPDTSTAPTAAFGPVGNGQAPGVSNLGAAPDFGKPVTGPAQP